MTKSVHDNPSANPFGITGPAQRRAKIVCTIGPACSSEEMIRQLMQSGMDVARLNFSHGAHEDHALVIQRLRKVAIELERTICILQDLQGPKIRTGRLMDRIPIALQKGQTVTITSRDVMGTADIIATTYQDLANDVKPGEHILLSDGRIELVVQQVRDGDVVCDVLNGGMLGEHQGINLPGTNVSIPSLTPKDEVDLEFGLKHAVDAVAISFVRTAEDVLRAQRAITSRGFNVPLVAKLEKPQAIDNLDSILEAATGVMVARGDLGVEVAPEKVPLIQKLVIRRALDFRRPVITATQMLESMTESPRPTRAEASDVANAVFDGTDAVMLSGETAVGQYPREAVEMMARIVTEAESDPFPPLLPRHRQAEAPVDCRDHLRVDGACRGTPRSARHRRLHGDGHHRPHAFQVSARRRHLCLYAVRGGMQPYEFAVGSYARAMPCESVGGTHGRVRGERTDAHGSVVAGRCVRSDCGHDADRRSYKFPASHQGR